MMKHKQKVKLARKIRTKEELKTRGQWLFGTRAWVTRKKAIADRVKRKIDAIKKRKEERLLTKNK